jgi:hypothetical protein
MKKRKWIRLAEGRLLLAAMFAVAFAWSAVAQTASHVTLAWDSSEDPAAGYRVYYGASSGSYSDVIDAGASTTVTISNLSIGETYYFAATAYNAIGVESPHSAEIFYTVPGVEPMPLQIIEAPVSEIATTGTSVTLSVTASGSGTLTYQWFRDGMEIPGATGAAYTIARLDETTVGAYTVTVSDGTTSITTAAAQLGTLHMEVRALIVINGALESRYRIDYQDALDAEWTVLAEVSLPFSPYYHLDNSASYPSTRFYRVAPVE